MCVEVKDHMYNNSRTSNEKSNFCVFCWFLKCYFLFFIIQFGPICVGGMQRIIICSCTGRKLFVRTGISSTPVSDYFNTIKNYGQEFKLCLRTTKRHAHLITAAWRGSSLRTNATLNRLDCDDTAAAAPWHSKPNWILQTILKNDPLTSTNCPGSGPVPLGAPGATRKKQKKKKHVLIAVTWDVYGVQLN